MYGAAAFVVLQVADIIFPALGLPDWTFRLTVVASLLGFPLVLVVAWVFDLTPEGVRRTEDGVGAHVVGRTARLALLGVTVVLVFGAAWLSYRWARAGAPVGVGDRKTVAVLPFEDFNRSDATAFFADGLHEDVLSQLAKISDLRVISRTSVLQYAGGAKTVGEIGHELGAGTILEGSVRQSGDSIRVVLQLVDVSTDAHLWTETYDRPKADVFQVQSEIAEAVASALQAELSDEERQRIAARPTADIEAYNLYQQGRIHFDRSEDRRDALAAVTLFEQAVERDPAFAAGWSALSVSRMWLYQTWPDFAEEAALAREALARAEELAPEAAETRLAQGYFETWGQGNYERALEHFQAASHLLPSDPQPREAIGLVLRAQGRWDDSVAELEQAFDLNPRSYHLAFVLAETLGRMRLVPQAQRYLDLAMTLAPDLPAAYDLMMTLTLDVAGDTAGARQFVSSQAQRVGAEFTAEAEARLAAAAGDLDTALARTRASRGTDASGLARYYRTMGLLLHASGLSDERAVFGDSLQAVAEAFLTESSGRAGTMRPGMVASAHGDLGVAQALKGEPMRAIREGATATALLPVARDAFAGVDQLETLARIYMLVGEYETALDEVELILSMPAALSAPGLGLDPVFAPLRDHPRFEALGSAARPTP
jgi:TolB-like protein/Tfp pilus assembly protein PilF